VTEAFAKAFVAAQKAFPSIGKGRTAAMGNYSYKYADLGDVLDAALPVLHANGLALSQAPVSEDGNIGVETRLYHESGHSESFGVLLLPAGGTPQNAGSAMTYARRYAACAALGIVADEDDDGRVASQPPPVEAKASPEERLQNRMKAKAFDLAGGNRDLAEEFFEAYKPEKWTLENVEISEKAMETGVGK
jgi:hypothetical protein